MFNELTKMTDNARLLQLLLRVIGSVALLAIPCALMPYSWMNTIHQWLGMGVLPGEPVVGYLARSTSAFYGLLGGLLWVLSGDLRRHRLVLLYVGSAVAVFGLLLLGVDILEGMPPWWTAAEGPFNIGLGVVILALSWRLH
jgi:hypothetical protein